MAPSQGYVSQQKGGSEITKYVVRKENIKGVRGFRLLKGLGTPTEIQQELQNMIDVLLDRVDSPVDPDNPLALMTVANAYLARAREIEFLILGLERTGEIKRTPRAVDTSKADPYYKLRTGELQSFIEIAEKAVEEGSRRLSAEQLVYDRSVRGLG